MELNDLRRQWQQAPVPATDLVRLLGKAPLGLIDRMRRNTWYEILAFPIMALPLLVVPGPGYRVVYVGVMLPLVVVMGFYYARQLRQLRQMSQTDASLHQHLQALCQGLRQLLAFYYRLTSWIVLPTWLLLIGYTIWKEVHLGRSGGPRWLSLGLLVGLAIPLGFYVRWGVLRFTRQLLQRLYGQHLDRLEGQLRELEEGAPAV